MSSHIVPIMQPAVAVNPEAMEITQTTTPSTQTTLERTTSYPTTVRGTSVKLSVPLDSKPRTITTTHKLMRRDSLDRREAFLKGKEGSRQRRRWENDRLLNNPYAEPPLPSDWEIRPTYPVRRVPYFLAPLWDAAEFQRAVESKLKGRRNTRTSKRNKSSGSAGISPFEEAAMNIPKEVKGRLKHARSAKGLLQDLEEDVRRFLVKWNEREIRLRMEGLHDAPLPISLPIRSKPAKRSAGAGDTAILTDTEAEEEDEEIVFVGRGGKVTSDSPSHKRRQEEENLLSEKLVFEGTEDDKGAAFGRWLAHCIGSYYGLRTWSITVAPEIDADAAKLRQAYVGVDSRVRTWMGQGWEAGREFELPRPLWAMV